MGPDLSGMIPLDALEAQAAGVRRLSAGVADLAGTAENMLAGMQEVRDAGQWAEARDGLYRFEQDVMQELDSAGAADDLQARWKKALADRLPSYLPEKMSGRVKGRVEAARENLAASGLANTGISETTNLGLQTAYQQALDSINQNKQSALQGLDQAKVQAQSTGNADIASLQSQYLQQMATMKQEYEQEMYNRWLTEQQLTARQSDADWNKQLAMQQYNYQLQQMQQAQGDSESDRLYKLLNAGVLSPEVLQWAGLNSADDYYNMLRQMQIAQTVPKTSSGRSARQVSSGNSYDGLFADTSGSGSTAAAATQSGGGLFNATYNGKQYQLTADELSTLIRTQQPIDYLSNLLR